MFKDDVGVVASGEFTDLFSKALPLFWILGGFGLPEAVTLSRAVDNQFCSEAATDVCFLRT